MNMQLQTENKYYKNRSHKRRRRDDSAYNIIFCLLLVLFVNAMSHNEGMASAFKTSNTNNNNRVSPRQSNIKQPKKQSSTAAASTVAAPAPPINSSTLSKIVQFETSSSSLVTNNRTRLIPRQQKTMPGIQVPYTSTLKNPNNIRQEISKAKLYNQKSLYRINKAVPESFMSFTKEIHAVDRISATEEVALGSLTQEALRVENIYTKLTKKMGREPTDDEWCSAAGKINMDCLKSCIDEGMKAKDKLIVSNLRMVQRVVNIYIRNGLGGEFDVGDLMQDGMVALIRAAEKFDPKMGYRFSTYAMYWIRSAIKRSQMQQSRIVHVPHRVHDFYKQGIAVAKELEVELGREPTDEEIAKRTGFTLEKWLWYKKSMTRRVYSLDNSLTNRHSVSTSESFNKKDQYDLIPDQNIANKMEQSLLKEDLIKSLTSYLDREEATLLLLRYGLMDDILLSKYGIGGPLSIREVGELAGMTPDRVRRKINKSLTKLKYLMAHEWPEYSRQVIDEIEAKLC